MVTLGVGQNKMKDENKLKNQLIKELTELRHRINNLEALEARRRQAEVDLDTERKRLFSLLDGLPAFIYLQAADYSIRFANRYFLECFGEPGGKPCFEAINGIKEPCKECLTLRVFETNEPQRWEWAKSDGRTYKIYDYPFKDIDGTPLVLELGIDITEQKQLEKTRSELFANVSHELRTPLMKIQGYVEALRDGLYVDENEFFQYINIIYLNMTGISRLISDLFDLSKLEAKQFMNFQRLSLSKYLPRHFDKIQLFLEREGIYFSYTMDKRLPLVVVDIDRITQVLNNLVDNAAKYTPEGGSIKISVSAQSNGIQVEVTDNGKGILESELPYIFTRFFKGKNVKTAKNRKGTGLGLAIAKAIIESHHGAIWAESKPGEGSRFFFTIPGAGLIQK